MTLPLDFVANKHFSLSSWCVYREIDQTFRHGLLDDQSMSPVTQCMRTKHRGWGLGLVSHSRLPQLVPAYLLLQMLLQVGV